MSLDKHKINVLQYNCTIDQSYHLSFHTNCSNQRKSIGELNFFGAFFVGKEKEVVMNRKTIYCPICGRAAIHYDGRSTMVLYGRCKKCNKIVYFYPKSGEVKIKNKQQRTTSSGMTFI